MQNKICAYLDAYKHGCHLLAGDQISREISYNKSYVKPDVLSVLSWKVIVQEQPLKLFQLNVMNSKV